MCSTASTSRTATFRPRTRSSSTTSTATDCSDLIIGASHEYGLAWLEQKVDAAGKRTFTQHWIEKDFGQFHTFELGDLNGDGKPDLVTGKRLFAHHGEDISAFDPLFAFWYDLQGGKFERHILSYNHLPFYPGMKNLNPPPNGAIGVGMKLIIADMDKDGRNDVVVAGKPGLYVFFNKGFAPRRATSTSCPHTRAIPRGSRGIRRTEEEAWDWDWGFGIGDWIGIGDWGFEI